MNFDPASLTDELGVQFDPELLQLAMMHRSFAYENGNPPTNERLEFLGDAVLGIVITDALFRRYPDCSEGQLAKFRAAIVNSQALADVARSLGLGQHIYLGRGEEATGGRDKSSILADTLEAVIGALYLSVGIARTSDVILGLFDPLIDHAAQLGAGLDWKTSLQEVAARAGVGTPIYRVTHTGPDHAREFSAEVCIDDQVLGRGSGPSKKVAEQHAAAEAYPVVAAMSDA